MMVYSSILGNHEEELVGGPAFEKTGVTTLNMIFSVIRYLVSIW